MSRAQLLALNEYPWVVSRLVSSGEVIAHENGILDAATLTPVETERLLPSLSHVKSKRALRQWSRRVHRSGKEERHDEWVLVEDVAPDSTTPPPSTLLLVQDGVCRLDRQLS